MKETLNKFWQSVRGWLPGLLISLLALWFISQRVDWKMVSESLTKLPITSVLLAALLVAISLVTRSLAWWTLLERRASIPSTFFTLNIGYLLNNFLPLRAGEVGRAVLMGRATKQGTFYTVSTIVIERAYDLAVAAGMMLATVPMVLKVDWARPVAIGTLIAVVLGLGIMFFVARYHERLSIWMNSWGQRWPFLSRWILPRIESLLNGMAVLSQPGQFFLSIFWIIVSWAIYVATFYLLITPLMPEFPLWGIIFVNSVVALGVAVPSVPGGLGVYEAAMVLALSWLDVPESTALAYAITLHFLSYAVTGILGAWGLIREGLSLRGFLAEIQARKKEAATH